MEEPKFNNRLEVGEKIFYFDGFNQWDIETVESVNKAEKYVVLSNNAHISRYPNTDGTFTKLNQNGSFNSNKYQVIKRATPDMIKIRTAILSFKKIHGYMYLINNTLLKTTDINNWNRWSESRQDKLISIAGHLAKGIEEAELTSEDWYALAKSIEEPVENIKPVENKRKKKNKK